MEAGSRELARRATAHLGGIGFAVTYLAASASGAGADTALLRGCHVALAALILGRPLCQPVVDVVLDALARDEAARAAARAAKETP